WARTVGEAFVDVKGSRGSAWRRPGTPLTALRVGATTPPDHQLGQPGGWTTSFAYAVASCGVVRGMECSTCPCLRSARFCPSLRGER
ncbi:unnamed protein product, partial [Ectocarpus sp. 12 AP-2014]